MNTINAFNLELEIVKQVTDVFNTHEVPCWIDQGTLLGVIRDGKFLPYEWDHDFDFGAWWSDYDNHRVEIVKNLAKAGWQVRQHSNRVLILKNTQNISRPVSIAFYHHDDEKAVKHYTLSKFRKLRWWHFRSRVFRKFAHLSEVGAIKAQEYYKLSKYDWPVNFLINSSHFFRSRIKLFLKKVRVECPAIHFTKLDEIELQGAHLYVPSKCSDYLRLKYGDTWQTPKQEWDYLKDDGGLKNLKS